MSINLHLGDCIDKSEEIESGSVDLILTDLPYGTMTGINATFSGYGRKNHDGHSWDIAIEPKKVFEIANRILRKNGKMVLFSQEPYTNRLITEAIANVPFSYRMVWEKDNFANALLSKKAPVSYFEDVLVFSKLNPKHDSEITHPLRPYFKQVFDFIGISKKQLIEKVGQKADHVFRFESSQFSLCTESTYLELVDVFGVDGMVGFKTFDELSEIDKPFKSNLNNKANSVNPAIFNLWEGNAYKSNILKYKKDYDGHHPTQKPVLLLEDLIKTFSNEGDLVVDLTMGSGSTGVACKNTKRDFIGIEKDENYFNIASKRIENHRAQTRLF